jgi:hypothetical protein
MLADSVTITSPEPIPFLEGQERLGYRGKLRPQLEKESDCPTGAVPAPCNLWTLIPRELARIEPMSARVASSGDDTPTLTGACSEAFPSPAAASGERLRGGLLQHQTMKVGSRKHHQSASTTIVDFAKYPVLLPGSCYF